MAALCVGSAHASEKIRYEDIPAHIASWGEVLNHRSLRVTTLDGKQHAARAASFETSGVRLYHDNEQVEDLPGDQITRIEIAKGGRYFHHIEESADFPLSRSKFVCEAFADMNAPSPECLFAMTAVFSPEWAYTAVTAPLFLVADGIAWLIPPKVFEIVR